MKKYLGLMLLLGAACQVKAVSWISEIDNSQGQFFVAFKSTEPQKFGSTKQNILSMKGVQGEPHLIHVPYTLEPKQVVQMKDTPISWEPNALYITVKGVDNNGKGFVKDNVKIVEKGGQIIIEGSNVTGQKTMTEASRNYRIKIDQDGQVSLIDVGAH